MPELEISYDPEIWTPVDEAATDHHEDQEVAEAMATLRESPRIPGGGMKFLLLGDPVEPPIVVYLTAVGLAVTTSRAGAESVFPDAAAEQLEEVQLSDEDVACRYVRFRELDESLSVESTEGVIVAELHYVRAIRTDDLGCVLIASAVTSRIDDLAGIAVQVEGLIALAAVS